MQKSQLKGQIALVTGANRGIGRQISIDLARAGATVILAARDIDSLVSKRKMRFRQNYIQLNLHLKRHLVTTK